MLVFSNERPQSQTYDMVLEGFAAPDSPAQLAHLEIAHSELMELPQAIPKLRRLQSLDISGAFSTTSAASSLCSFKHLLHPTAHFFFAYAA
jgi:hypothetical protein